MNELAITYTSEDGMRFGIGARMFNYYDRAAGVVVADAGGGWFDLLQDDGRRTMLDGSRVCSIELAVAKGWIEPELAPEPEPEPEPVRELTWLRTEWGALHAAPWNDTHGYAVERVGRGFELTVSESDPHEGYREISRTLHKTQRSAKEHARGLDSIYRGSR